MTLARWAVVVAAACAGCGGDEPLLPISLTVASFTAEARGSAIDFTADVETGGRRVDLEYDVDVFQAATGVRVATLSGRLPAAGRARLSDTWEATTDDAYHGRLDLRAVRDGVIAGRASPAFASFDACPTTPDGCVFASTSHVCNLVGLAGDPNEPSSIPYNHPVGPASDAPLIAAIDLGHPIVHRGKVYVMFGDTITMDRDGKLIPLGRRQQFPLGLAPGNDDAMAVLADGAGSIPPPTAERCLDLDFFETEGGEAATVSLDSPFEIDGTGGSFLGALFVGGGGFSAAGKLFAWMPDGRRMCRPGAICDHFESLERCARDSDCREPGDRCLTHSALPDGRRFCFYGPDCGAPGAPESPVAPICHPRRKRALLAVSPRSDNEFVTATEGQDVAAGFYPDADGTVYDGRFAAASFAVSNGRVFTFGRPRAVGSARAPADVHLAMHEVTGGLLGRARYFAGCATAAGVAPDQCRETSTFADTVWSSDPSLARPLFTESRAIVNKQHVVHVPHLDRWVMIYGGRLPLSFLHDPSGLWRLVNPTLSPTEDSDPRIGIYVRTAPHPWGPWSGATTIYSAWTRFGSGYCDILHYRGSPDPEDGVPETPPSYLHCDPPRNDALDLGHEDHGAEYGPALIPTLATPFGERGATVYWLMSTWNPYRIVVMKTDLSFDPFLPPAAREALMPDRARASRPTDRARTSP